jgi:predicted TIM-barrel fold metal-dependent hydrolase
MKIDIFAHILPPKYLAAYGKLNPAVMEQIEVKNRGVIDLETRLRAMDRYPDVLQVLTISQPPLEKFVNPPDAVELARTGNDELAELVERYPDRFAGAVACLPMNDVDASLREAERAIRQLNMKGVQIYSRVHGETLDNPKFKPLYKLMALLNMPIWIHPTTDADLDTGGILGWPFETSAAMYRLVLSGVFNDNPDIKFITHHAGGMISFYERRLRWLLYRSRVPDGIKDPVEHFRKFYNDTALYGCTAGLMCAYAFFGPRRLLYGTDAPLGPRFEYGLTEETIESIQKMTIPEDEKEMILGGNAREILSLSV